uniref:Uncharacterized protein n=1 Tax=Coturnix japonica TaxID=93934 RepID=A0A8C2TTW1_COTJA
MHLCAHLCTHVSIQVPSVRLHIHLCICACQSVYPSIHQCVCLHVCLHICVSAYTFICVHLFICVCICLHVHLCIHMSICVSACTSVYLPVPRCPSPLGVYLSPLHPKEVFPWVLVFPWWEFQKDVLARTLGLAHGKDTEVQLPISSGLSLNRSGCGTPLEVLPIPGQAEIWVCGSAKTSWHTQGSCSVEQRMHPHHHKPPVPTTLQ